MDPVPYRYMESASTKEYIQMITDINEALFNEMATYAQLWAERLYENSAWSTALQQEDYIEWNGHWLNGLTDEVHEVYAAIGIYAATGAGPPTVHLFVIKTMELIT
ncbi:hypothetical protein L208DRAFT_1379057 [Tricholoma matsutake]|nr:hypothetical protein L208DRAFT_1379057 [Tricholoma matsutake 945]